MSDQTPESVSQAELMEILEGKPLLLRNLGFAAYNAGLFESFQEMVANDEAYVQIKHAIERGIKDSGIAADASDILTLFDLPDDFDDE